MQGRGNGIEPMTHLPPDEAKAMLVSMLADFAENDLDNLVPYLKHIGFDISVLSDPKELPEAWVAHYRVAQGTYDADRALIDFQTWPPMARRIFELLHQPDK